MEIASNAQAAENLREELLAAASSVHRIGRSVAAPGDAVPGDTQRVSTYNILSSLLEHGVDGFEREARRLTAAAQSFEEADAAASASTGS